MNKHYSGIQIVSVVQQDLDTLFKNGELDATLLPAGNYYPNECLVLKAGNKKSGLGIYKGDFVRLVDSKSSILGVTPKNKEQAMVMGLLKDKDIDLLCLSGVSGSGKTLLSLAYSYDRLKNGEIDSIVLIKNPVSVGRELGHLPGNLLEKMRAWGGNFMDNFRVLGVPDYELDDMLDEQKRIAKRSTKKIELIPLTHIQGRSISNSVVILDEAENVDNKAVQQVISRASDNCKVILIGDPQQVYAKELTPEKNGLVHVIEKAKTCEFAASLTMIKSERSRLAQWAWDNL